MAIESDYEAVVRTVTNWPAERRASLAHALVESLRQEAQSRRVGPKPSLDQLVGIARGNGPAPTDEQVRQMIDEHRMEKYGR